MTGESLPLFTHRLETPSAFTPERLMDAVRAERGLPREPVPPLCVLDFDGDLSDHLAGERVSSPWASWACFHTSMRVATIAGVSCGIVPRTIGGPYAVLVAEQLRAAGARLIVGITSAGRVSPDLPLPSIVVVNQAIRDEGTSFHYLPPSGPSRHRRRRSSSRCCGSCARWRRVCGKARSGRPMLRTGKRRINFSIGRQKALWPWRCRRRRCLPSPTLAPPPLPWSRWSATASIERPPASTPAAPNFA